MVRAVISDGALGLLARRKKQGLEDVKAWLCEKYGLENEESESEESSDDSESAPFTENHNV